MLEQKYISQQNAIASYNYVDVADGTGIVRLYGGTTATSAATYLRLDSNVFISALPHYTSGSNNNTVSYVKIVDADFDTSPFNSPRILQGKALASVPCMMSANSQVYLVVNISLVSGGVETQIATAQSPNITTANTASYICLPITINPTAAKVGDILRITVEVWHRSTSGTSYGMIAYDPLDALIAAVAGYGAGFAAGETLMQFLVPFRIMDA